MYFYVDESGQTGLNLFDATQPVLYYGVLSSRVDLNVNARPEVEALRAKLDVDRLHANVLGIERLTSISQELEAIQQRCQLSFDIYRVSKLDHAAISFFDQIFDQGLNKAVPWSSYWTPLRFPLLLALAALFDRPLLELAWAARIERRTQHANEMLVEVLQELLGRVGNIQDPRLKEIITDALRWGIRFTDKLDYNAQNRQHVLQISPNLIGFQSVLHGISSRLKRDGGKAVDIIVDQQSQFNNAQRMITEFYQQGRDLPEEALSIGPGLPVMDLKHMPDVAISCVPGTTNVGLELVDVYLWLFKRFFEGKPLSEPLMKLISGQFEIGYTDQISLAAIAERWSKYFANLPPITQAQLKRGLIQKARSEDARRAHLKDL
ncbi:DUF3800 domain-containing protein [Pseudomonas shirazensis]|uniref:DUF3800 domain-containing protein n=1 Tax=Pseudomonas shirazensis TaxID=2745494 RepID=A0ABU8ZUA9_9PSED